jgi:hypothetical protein
MKGVGIDRVLVQAHKLYTRCQQERSDIELVGSHIHVEVSDKMCPRLFRLHRLG